MLLKFFKSIDFVWTTSHTILLRVKNISKLAYQVYNQQPRLWGQYILAVGYKSAFHKIGVVTVFYVSKYD